MKTNPIFSTVIFIAALLAGRSIYASDNAKSNEAPLPPSGAEQPAVDAPLTIDHMVYLAKLPSPDELMRGADLKGTPIIRMDQTADRIVAVYQYADGRRVTFAFALLSSASADRNITVVNQPVSTVKYTVVTPSPAPPVVVAPPAASPSVVYVQSSPYYYYPPVSYYNSAWDFWAPFAVGVGFGWVGGHYYGHGGDYHGHGGGHGHH